MSFCFRRGHHGRRAGRLLSGILAALMLSCLVSGTASAARVDADTSLGRVGILAITDGVRRPDVRFSAYHIADYDAKTGEMTLFDAYSKYGLSLKSETFAKSLWDYLRRGGVKPDFTATSNADGEAAFESLLPGAYLITCQDFTAGDYVYSGIPTLAYLPYLDGDEPDYYAEIEFKFTSRRTPKPSEPDHKTVTRKALKTWDDDGDAAGRRPTRIQVELLRNGKHYDAVWLSGKNNWKYTWTDLDAGYDWSVVETEVPDGYELSIDKKGVTYVLSNALIPETPPEEPPVEIPPVTPTDPVVPTPTPPSPGEPGRPEPGQPSVPQVPSDPGTPKIPQTGNPTWAVIVCTGLGLVLLLIGFSITYVCSETVHKRVGLVLCIIGSCFVLAALALTGWFMWDAARVERNTPDISGSIAESQDFATASALGQEAMIPDYVLNPGMDMPTAFIDGRDYVGQLEIVSQGLELPVLANLTYPGLKISPARYSGSAYDGSLVIGAHNYDAHFGRLKYLNPGDEVLFRDMDGNEFVYSVKSVDVLNPYAVDELIQGNAGLTLFTCTYGGLSRVVVRCEPDPAATPDWAALV